ncbi:DUF459 domain-containing protein [Tropicimonas sp.]|uniref:SGNH/GDSL hydrolase family protein n=1 Tax=Tropicimonas sp. TaxID=2067044 RepID=UPI003A83E033
MQPRIARQSAYLFAALFLSASAAFPVDRPAGADTVADAPRVIAVFGDSIATGYCQGLKRQLTDLPEYSVKCWTKPSSGLTRDDFFDWDAELQRRLASIHVDYAVVSMGGNDAQDMTLPDRILDFSGPEWAEEYGRRVAGTVERLRAAGVEVFWIGMPIARSEAFSDKLRRLNRIYADRALAGGAAFIPIWDFTAGEAGSYSRTLPDADGRMRVARQKDGIHFNGPGEQIVTCYILKQMAPATGIPDTALRC